MIVFCFGFLFFFFFLCFFFLSEFEVARFVRIPVNELTTTGLAFSLATVFLLSQQWKIRKNQQPTGERLEGLCFTPRGAPCRAPEAGTGPQGPENTGGP